MSDYQMDMFSYPVTKWEVCQIRIQPDLKEKAMIELRKDGLNMSLFIRMALTRYLKNKEGLRDPRMLEPVGNSVQEVMDYLPVILKNRFYKRGY